MIKIGITGGIGSGKSVVAELFSVFGVPVYSADTEAKRLSDSCSKIRQQLIALFGHDIYTREGLDRKKLASFIFNDKELLLRVNRIIHPEVIRDFQKWVRYRKSDYCAIESAILFESGLNELVDKTLMVYAPVEIRIARTVSRDNIPAEVVRKRIDNQMSDETKKERSDYTIYNDGRMAIIPQVHRFFDFFPAQKFSLFHTL